MKIINCPDSKLLVEFYDGSLNDAKKDEISHHLEACERCSKSLQVLKKLDEFLFMEAKTNMNESFIDLKTKECITDDLLYRYIEGNVTAAEAEAIEQHLNLCPACFSDLASVVKNSLTPITDFEQSEIAKIRTITADEQVSKILEYCGQFARQPEKRKKVKITTTILNRIKQFFEKWIYTRYAWRPAIAFAVLLIIFIGVRPGIRNYIVGKQISRAETILSEFYKVPKGDARLTGGFDPSSLGELMAANEKQPDYLEKAESNVNRAIKNKSNSLKARQILAKVYLIEKQTSKADSIFLQMEAENIKSASLLNDIGVLYFHKKNWKQAAYYFQSAIEIDENLLEAYYNLALVKNNLNQFVEATTILNEYLKIEHNENWRRFALQLRDEINNNLEELK
jgi:tetratricopeptide (TPR) repeat protein